MPWSVHTVWKGESTRVFELVFIALPSLFFFIEAEDTTIVIASID